MDQYAQRRNDHDPSADCIVTADIARIKHGGKNERSQRHEQHCNGEDYTEYPPKIILIYGNLYMRHELDIK